MPKKKIFIVDDEESLCRSLKMYLEETGKYEVQTATRGLEALVAFKENTPDIIILDQIMPDITGREVYEELQKDQKLKSVPVIFVTATVTEKQRSLFGDEKLLVGKNVFAKPIKSRDLVKHIEANLK